MPASRRQGFEHNERASPRKPTSDASVEAIAYHYDVGTEFYRLWLDRNLTYSAARWGDPRQIASALASTFRILLTCHLPPRAVRTPRLLRVTARPSRLDDRQNSCREALRLPDGRGSSLGGCLGRVRRIAQSGAVRFS
ncbi:class I SAM-dependent methyltransferase [Pseudaminobacter sp. 19-2017]|uniref:Class I SAM-dependent methyltransferase n=1 Tax=Pseudaminobacter soli (ex Zhang et al. 2022) TaxID=2831468 RepID=A0A942E7B1_9HYPH|nr:class I SAM-dependent methyltransferase [Pseudaminobacter soli]MBS3652448.1 class I SAM-dependent methyltransferase [Pseudaminobacter soli]